MWLKRYRVMINVNSQTFSYQITHFLSDSLVLEQKSDIAFATNPLDAKETINKVFESIHQYLPNAKQNQFVFEIHISPLDVKHKILPLPPVTLSAGEMPLLVESSIDKLFQLSACDVTFDYINPVKDKRQLYIAICDQSYIAEWTNLFLKLDLLLQFIGLVIDENMKFNFLPWRQSQQRKRKIRLTVMLITYIGLILFTLSYLWSQSHDGLYQYKQRVIEKQIVEQALLNKLSETSVRYSQSQQKLYQFLKILSEKIPPYISLDSLNYFPPRITLAGNALSYLAITQFSDLLNQEEQVQKSKIQSVVLKQNNLTFQMDVDLYD